MTDKKTRVRSDPHIDLNTLGDNELLEQLREKQTKDFDDLVGKYNKQQERLEGAETHNQMLQDQINELKSAIKVLNDALSKPNIIRNKNRGEWIKFDCSNVQLTRPIINMFNRFKDRPKELYLEILGDEVIEVSETRQ